MRHFVFRFPLLISEEDPETGAIQDAARQHMDVHVYAPDLSAAVARVQGGLQIIFGDDAPPSLDDAAKGLEAADVWPPDYVGPV